MIRINPLWFVRYKFVNSIFLGLSLGALFTIYAPLEPSTFSIGGVALAAGMLIVARLYRYILNAKWFFRISLCVELLLLLAVGYFLIFPYGYQTALILYIAYQLSFVFGSYLVRTETLLLDTDELLMRLDTAKQIGYLAGMAVGYLFYKSIEQYGITANQDQIYALHYLLLAIEVIIIILLLKSFQNRV